MAPATAAQKIALSKYVRTEHGRAKKRAKTREYQHNKRALIRAERERQGCKDCGEKDGDVLDFHHIGDKHPLLKQRSPSRGCWINLSNADLLAEIARCEVLCANCHRCQQARDRRAAKVGG